MTWAAYRRSPGLAAPVGAYAAHASADVRQLAAGGRPRGPACVPTRSVRHRVVRAPDATVRYLHVRPEPSAAGPRHGKRCHVHGCAGTDRPGRRSTSMPRPAARARCRRRARGRRARTCAGGAFASRPRPSSPTTSSDRVEESATTLWVTVSVEPIGTASSDPAQPRRSSAASSCWISCMTAGLPGGRDLGRDPQDDDVPHSIITVRVGTGSPASSVATEVAPNAAKNRQQQHDQERGREDEATAVSRTGPPAVLQPWGGPAPGTGNCGLGWMCGAGRTRGQGRRCSMADLLVEVLGRSTCMSQGVSAERRRFLLVEASNARSIGHV